MQNTEHFIQFLQDCITPVALISGIGLLVLTLTNRMGRIIDRVRILIAELDDETTKRKEEKKNEIAILYKRAKAIRTSIALITLSIICSSLIVFILALSILGGLDIKFFGYILFGISITSFILSAIWFFRDVILSLKAIRLEIKEHV